MSNSNVIALPGIKMPTELIEQFDIRHVEPPDVDLDIEIDEISRKDRENEIAELVKKFERLAIAFMDSNSLDCFSSKDFIFMVSAMESLIDRSEGWFNPMQNIAETIVQFEDPNEDYYYLDFKWVNVKR